MKRYMKYAVLLSMACLLYSCTKFGKNITVKGRVLNPITGEGYSGATVELIRTQNLQYEGGYKELKHTITDQNGAFEISAYYAGTVWAQVQVGGYNLGWLYNGKYYSMIQVTKGKVMHMDYHIVPYGKLQIRMKNISCFNNLDKVAIYFDGEYMDTKTFMKGLLYEKYGCVDVLDSPVKTTMGNKYFHWIVTKDNVTSTYYDTIFVNADQTATLNVFY